VLDLRDILYGRSYDLIPPRRLHFVGGGDFRIIGEKFLEHFIEMCNLQPYEKVLDIGCGTGRMAIPLMKFLEDSGSYRGFDISKRAIMWCKKHISTRSQNFSFFHADIYNKEYNPKGKLSANTFRFPCDDESIDFAFATSVFTHMRPPEVKQYLKELRCSLKPDRRAFLTFFIINDVALSFMEQGKSSPAFHAETKGFYTIDSRTPERAIAYSESVIRELCRDAGLLLQEPIRYGSWSGREAILNSHQDVVIVTKGSSG
jgi:SAM-dependent methyltransferase